MKGFDFTVRTMDDLAEAVETFGIVPLFRSSVPGFSVEEHTVPECWYTEGSGEWKVWDWKGPVIRQTGCAYGKFFEKKAVFVSASLFPDLANYRRDGYDFDARYDDGLASRKDLELFTLIDKNAHRMKKELIITCGTVIDGREVVYKAPNVFLIRTKSLRKVGYDPNIRMLDHHEFFIRAAGVLVCVQDRSAYIMHCHNHFENL